MILNQRSARYSNLFLGNTKVSFNGYGCTTCAVKAGIERITKKKYTIEQIMDCIVYNKNGLIVWNKCDWEKLGVSFVWRHYRKPSTGDYPILLSGDHFAVLQINKKKHWVLFINSDNTRTTVSDPYGRNKTDNYGYSHTISNSDINGFALFKKI